MSTLFLGGDSATLAEKLAFHLDPAKAPGDFFIPTSIVIPNLLTGQWLRLQLARLRGVVANFKFTFLEKALWDLLRAVDPRQHEMEPEVVDDDSYQLLVLATLLQDENQDLEVLRRYFQSDKPFDRRGSRRVFRLAQRLASSIRDYEYHRQNELIQPWLKNKVGLGEVSPALLEQELAQKAIFTSIVQEGTGRRARLGQALGKNLRTLPQYAMELVDVAKAQPLNHVPQRTIHLFGVTQISLLHLETLRWLGDYVDVKWYFQSNQWAWSKKKPTRKSLEQFRDDLLDGNSVDEKTPWRQWGRAGAESSWIMGQLLKTGSSFQVEVAMPAAPSQIPHKKVGIDPGTTVLSQLQAQLRRPPEGANWPRRPQDQSLQILACPGLAREVETVYQSILDNLNKQPDLRHGDIAVLATDLSKYRSALKTAFERLPRQVTLNVVEPASAAHSQYGQALLGMLDISLESFTRSRVLAVLLNPCFLARLGIDQAQAQTWVNWIHQLGIHQSWDAADKAERGYDPSPWFGWKLGLQRLRLGRFMDTGPGSRFGDVLPFADIDASDRAQVNAFSRAIEYLLPALGRMRRRMNSAAGWADLIRSLMNQFLEIPEDRPEEKLIRDGILYALERWQSLDSLMDHPTTAKFPLELLREYMASILEKIPNRPRESFPGGVVLASLAAARQLPFEIIYVVGLGEANFPGTNQLPPHDLRNHQRRPGDILPAEQNRFVFHETILAARRKLYLSYDARDLLKDHELLPAAPLQQLRRYLNDCVLDQPFLESRPPLHACDPILLDPEPSGQHDVFVQYHVGERCLALAHGQESGQIRLSSSQQAELQDTLARNIPDFTIPPAVKPPRLEVDVKLNELKAFLGCPALASLRRHLLVADDQDDETETSDDEPFACPRRAQGGMVRAILHQGAIAAGSGTLDQFLKDWPLHLRQEYDLCQLRGQAPEGAFAEVDHASVEALVRNRLEGGGKRRGLISVLEDLRAFTFCGPLLLGASLTPLQPRRRFPPTRLTLADGRTASLHGSTPLAWHDEKQLVFLTVATGKILKTDHISMYLVGPVLLYLSLLANSNQSPEGLSARDWLLGKDLVFKLAGADQVASFTYPANAISPEMAEEYLRQLTQDFLDDQTYDLLPLEVIVADSDLRTAYIDQGLAPSMSKVDYRQNLQEAIAAARENDHAPGFFWGTDMEDLAGAAVPEDALDKVRRRFSILDIGPARVRIQDGDTGDGEEFEEST